MPPQKWKVLVTKLGVENVLYEGEVNATNWMGALRAAREGMAERPSVPPGVSCSIDGQGIATVLDPGSRRRFVLAPSAVKSPQSSIPPLSQRVEPHIPPNPVPAVVEPPRSNRKKFETVAFTPDRLVERPIAVAGSNPPPAAPDPWPAPARVAPAQPSPASAQAAPAPAAAPEPSKKKKKFETVAFAPGMAAAAVAAAQAGTGQSPPVRVADSGPVGAARTSAAPPSKGRSGQELELLLQRDEEPNPENPLYYCERAYLLPRGTSVPDAEAALRWKLADLQRALEPRKKGKLVNLAVFDHRWQDVPERPPVITLQWRDWRGEVVVDYPAAARESAAPPPAAGAHDDRLADVFEALGSLSRMTSPADALDFAVQLLDRTVLSEAISACLYDINTDELRFVALSGTGAAAMQGRAIPRSAGLFGQAAAREHHASVFSDIMMENAYEPDIDGRPGVDTRNVLLRPIVFEHQLLGMLQLINRRAKPSFTPEDAHLVSYVAERLAEYIHSSRKRRSVPPK